MSRCWAWRGCERAALSRLYPAVTPAPEQRTQEANQLPHPCLTPPCLWGPSRSLDVRVGSRKLAALCPHLGPAWSRATPAPVLGRWRGPTLPLISSLPHMTPGPGEWARAAPQAFWHLLPTEAVGRGCGPRADSPQATWLTATKAVSICLAKSAFTWFCSFVLGNGRHFSEDLTLT